jgi:hypothetical protein
MFKFVSSGSYEAHLAGKANQPDDRNGVVEVRWRKEKVPPTTYRESYSKGRMRHINRDIGPQSISCDFALEAEEGCTVAGSYSSQKFQTAYIGDLVPHIEAVIIRLVLKGDELRSTKAYCTECGHGHLPQDNSCGVCGKTR